MNIKFTHEEVLENHKRYLERKRLQAQFGCNVDEERTFILRQAGKLSRKILEAGTGKGYFSVILAKNGYRFVSFDISKTEILFAMMNLAYYRLEKSVNFRIENEEKISFSDGMFDVVFSINTLHHIDNIESSLNELVRVLSSKGKIILSDFTEKVFCLVDKVQLLEGKPIDEDTQILMKLKTISSKKILR